jgi:site-specific recombinase XerD
MGPQETPDAIQVTLTEFMAYLRKKKMSESTITAYASDVNSFLHRSAHQSETTDLSSLVAIQTKDLEDYLQNLAHSGSKFASVKRVSFALKRFFLFLLNQGLVHSNPAVTLAVKPVRGRTFSSDQIISIFQYLNQRQQSSEAADIVRYRRDELILLLMLFYGVRKYLLRTLRLSSIHTTKQSVSLVISTLFSLRLHASVLRKLRIYLEKRRSTSDTIFLESFSEKPVDKISIRHALNELSYALHFDCTPRTLHNTYLHLQQHPQIRESLIKGILSNDFTDAYDKA